MTSTCHHLGKMRGFESPVPERDDASFDKTATVSSAQLEAAQTLIIREIPDKMRRGMLGAFAGSAATAWDIRERWSTPIVYKRQSDPLEIVGRTPAEIAAAKEQELGEHTVASVFVTEELVRREMTFRHHNTRLILGEKVGDERVVEYVTMNRIPQRGHSIHAQNIDQVEYVTRTCLVSEEDFCALKEKDFPYAIKPEYIDPEEKAKLFVHGDQRFYLGKNNTTVRLFKDSTYNHLQVELGYGEKVRIFGEKAQAMVGMLFKDDFGQEYSPRVDWATQRIYEKAQQRALEEQGLQAQVDNIANLEALYAFKNPDAYEGTQEDVAVQEIPEFGDAYWVINSDEDTLVKQAAASWAEAKKIDEYAELASLTGTEAETDVETELKRDFPALSNLRAAFLDYTLQTGYPETTARNMLIGFDSVVITLMRCEQLREPLQLLEYPALTTQLGYGIYVTSSKSEGDPDLLERKIEELRTNFKPLWKLRSQLNQGIARGAVDQARMIDPDQPKEFSKLDEEFKISTRESAFGVSCAIATFAEYLEVAAQDKSKTPISN